MEVAFYATVFVGSILMLLWLRRGPFYVPTKRSYIPHIISLLALRPGEKMADLGSGNGRVLIALAQSGAEAHGFEHNPFLVWYSRHSVRSAGLEKKAFTHRCNFWHQDLSSFDAVVVYGIPYIMPRLERKLRAELRPGSRVVSNAFPFPNWRPAATYKKLYLYRQDERRRS
jgi:precorrin-6B methylase 2